MRGGGGDGRWGLTGLKFGAVWYGQMSIENISIKKMRVRVFRASEHKFLCKFGPFLMAQTVRLTTTLGEVGGGWCLFVL